MVSSPPGGLWRNQLIPLEWAGSGGIIQNLFKNGHWEVFKNGRVLEGTFIQVKESGEETGFPTSPKTIILGALASTARTLLPDCLVLLTKNTGANTHPTFEIPRFMPLEVVKLQVHSLAKRCLRLQLWTGGCSYLRLQAPAIEEASLFKKWMLLINLLQMTKAAPEGRRHLETQLWIQAVINTEEQWSRHASSKQCAAASEQSPSVSGALQPSPQEPSGIVQTEAYRSGNQPKDPPKVARIHEPRATSARRKVFYHFWTRTLSLPYEKGQTGTETGNRPMSRERSLKLKPPEKKGNAPELQKSATEREAQVTSQGSSKTDRPLKKGAGGLISQSSMKAPSASPVMRSCMSAAAGPSGACPKPVAIGPSKVGAVSVATGLWKPPIQICGVRPRGSEATSQRTAFFARRPWRYSHRARKIRHAWVNILDTVAEEEEEASGAENNHPISREISIKSKTSEKQETSASSVGLQHDNKTIFSSMKRKHEEENQPSSSMELQVPEKRKRVEENQPSSSTERQETEKFLKNQKYSSKKRKHAEENQPSSDTELQEPGKRKRAEESQPIPPMERQDHPDQASKSKS